MADCYGSVNDAAQQQRRLNRDVYEYCSNCHANGTPASYQIKTVKAEAFLAVDAKNRNTLISAIKDNGVLTIDKTLTNQDILLAVPSGDLDPKLTLLTMAGRPHYIKSIRYASDNDKTAVNLLITSLSSPTVKQFKLPTRTDFLLAEDKRGTVYILPRKRMQKPRFDAKKRVNNGIVTELLYCYTLFCLCSIKEWEKVRKLDDITNMSFFTSDRYFNTLKDMMLEGDRAFNKKGTREDRVILFVNGQLLKSDNYNTTTEVYLTFPITDLLLTGVLDMIARERATLAAIRDGILQSFKTNTDFLKLIWLSHQSDSQDIIRIDALGHQDTDIIKADMQFSITFGNQNIPDVKDKLIPVSLKYGGVNQIAQAPLAAMFKDLNTTDVKIFLIRYLGIKDRTKLNSIADHIITRSGGGKDRNRIADAIVDEIRDRVFLSSNGTNQGGSLIQCLSKAFFGVGDDTNEIRQALDDSKWTPSKVVNIPRELLEQLDNSMYTMIAETVSGSYAISKHDLLQQISRLVSNNRNHRFYFYRTSGDSSTIRLSAIPETHRTDRTMTKDEPYIFQIRARTDNSKKAIFIEKGTFFQH